MEGTLEGKWQKCVLENVLKICKMLHHAVMEQNMLCCSSTFLQKSHGFDHFIVIFPNTWHRWRLKRVCKTNSSNCLGLCVDGGEWGAQILKLEAASYVKNQLQPRRLDIKTNTFRINTVKQTWKAAEEQTHSCMTTFL